MIEVLATLATIGLVMQGILGGCSYLIWLERKVAAWIQDRVGPNRVGPAGLFQPIADGLKFILKEEVIPDHVNKFLYFLAPSIAVFTTMLAFAVVPFGPTDTTLFGVVRFAIVPNLDLGMVFVFAVGSLAVYGVILGGWASNNKYSALGSIRASAQVVSYEIPLGMSVLGIALMSSSLNLDEILNQQAAGGLVAWNFWSQPLACLIFFISALAESNRLPFDLSECEQELIGGYHTEYSAMKFAMFFLGEYTHMVTVSFLTIILFFGGWHLPGIATPESTYGLAWLVKVGVLLTKVLMVLVLMMFIRWTIPRFRFDQLMGLAWKILIPMATLNVLAVMTVLQFEWNRLWLLPISLAIFAATGLISIQTSIQGQHARVVPPRSRPLGAPAVAGHHH